MKLHCDMATRFAAILILTGLIGAQADAAVTASGSYWPTPLHAGDGMVTHELQLGLGVGSSGSVLVTDGDTLTTQDRAFLGYMVAASGDIEVIDSTWTAESAVFVAHTYSTMGNIHLTNSTWTVASNVRLASGENAQATVTLDGGSIWTTTFAVTLGTDENASATVHLHDGTWTAEAYVTVGGDDFTFPPAIGTVNINTAGLMDSEYGLGVTVDGAVHLDGGVLRLAGESTFYGALDAGSNGGTIEVLIGASAGGTGLVHVGDLVDFTDCTLKIAFRPDFAPDPAASYGVFSPMEGVQLATVLASADAIAPPIGWVLDHDTGMLGHVGVASCVSGPDAPATETCRQVYDFDMDGDVDLADFALLQSAQ